MQNNKKGFWPRAKLILEKKETIVFLLLIVIFIALSIASPFFLTASNLKTTLLGMSSAGILVVGMTLVLVLGGIDLSVGSIMGFVCMLSAILHVNMGVNIWISSLIGFVIGIACGVINGVLIGYMGLNAFITTLAMQGMVRGASMLISQGGAVSVANMDEAFAFLGKGSVIGIPMLSIIFIIIAVIFGILLKKLEMFRKVFYIGSNEKAASLSGINVKKTKVGVYTFAAIMASIAGVLSLSRFNAATNTTGDGAELDAIAAAVIGGASLNGGVGSILGAVLGVILLNVVDNALVLLKVSVYGQELVSGVILMLAILIDNITYRARMKVK